MATGGGTLSFVRSQLEIPHHIDELHFSTVSADATTRLSVLPCRRTGPTREKDYSVNDGRLGVCERVASCATCGLKQTDCVGHPGHVKLELPVFHLGFFQTVLRVCRSICKTCGVVLLTPEEKEYYRRKFLGNSLDALQTVALAKLIQAEAYKTRVCYACGSANGVVRRQRPMRIIHEQFTVPSGNADAATAAFEEFEETITAAIEYNKDIGSVCSNAQDFLDPQRVHLLFQKVPDNEVPLLGMKPGARPENLLLSVLPITPLPARPYGAASFGNGMREDDISTQYNDILASCDQMRDDRLASVDPAKQVESWDMLQLKVARLLDSTLPGFPAQVKGAVVKSFAQRMKGKHGRFRGNLSGKRVNYSGRSVISPDPNLDIDELALPLRIAKILTYPQKVFEQNLAAMRKLVLNGPECHPGACFVYFAKDKTRKDLRFDRETVAAKLSVGDIVERHVIDGDLLLFNRQPSLHRLSMMCHRAKVLPFRTLRFNECCCAPYNADFDGDEMNIHLVQTEEARAEALSLMSTTKNIITPKNGEPIISCTQDFLTGAYMLTSKDMFFDRAQFCELLSHWLKPGESFDLPPPTVLMPKELWTGKQLFSLMVNPRSLEKGRVNFEATARYYIGRGARFNCTEDGFIYFNNSKLLTGRLDKKILGGGAKDGLFANIHGATSGDHAGKCMSRIARTTSRWLMNYGFSLGIGDVSPTPGLIERKKSILAKAFEEVDGLIRQADEGRLELIPGMSLHQTLEAKINSELSKVRDECGTQAMAVLTPTNVPLNMAQSGGKGSTLNIAQMMACVGQQTVRGKRIPNSFIDRSLPHFPRFAKQPGARGFVANSFFTSLTPTEFYFHTMAGREGLVDTAVKTAETGYIYRRLMKAMEDMSVQYDYTVRNSKRDIVQFCYGEDMLDPVLMEGPSSTPLNLTSTWLSVINGKRPQGEEADEAALSPTELETLVDRELDAVATSTTRPRVSTRFLDDIRKFLAKKAQELSTARSGFQRGSAVHRDAEAKAVPKGTAKGKAKSKSLPIPITASTLPSESIDKHWLTQVTHLSKRNVKRFLEICIHRYRLKVCEPGTPCGALAAQSVGEPSTQMTLRTFHFAGVASMSITQGVPRLVEVINAAKSIATPVVTAPLLKSSSNPLAAQVIKSLMERVTLKEILMEMVEVVASGTTFLRFKLHRRLISDLQLEVTAQDVVEAILAYAAKPMSPLRQLKAANVQAETRDSFVVYPYQTDPVRMMFNIKSLAAMVPEITVSGIASVKRAIVTAKQDSKIELLAEGDELRSVMILPGVEGTKTTCNHVAAVEKVLGIEAARCTIVNEIHTVMSNYSLNIDVRHLYLLADVMTHRGVVLGITRFGIQKMNTSVLTMASFERTTEQLYDAAVYQRMDKCSSVSESIVVGSPIPLGTNAAQVLQHVPRHGPAALRKSNLLPKRPIFANRTGEFHVNLH